MIKTTGFTPDGDRYIFDWLCRPDKGWAQLDTGQDAWYFGIWINPLTLEYVSHIEGDRTHIQYDSEQEFQREIQECLDWHHSHGWNPHIDGMCNPAIIAAFERLGFKQWMH